MALKQKQTSLDGVLLKVVYPLLFGSGLGRQLIRWQVWHQDSSSPSELYSEPAKVTAIAPRLAARRQSRSLSPAILRQKRAA